MCLSEIQCNKMFSKFNIKLTFQLLIKIVIVAVSLFNVVNCQTESVTTVTETSTPLDLMPLNEGDVAIGNDLTINQFITNLSIFNDESNEYDTSIVMLLENVTHACLQKCMEEVSVKNCVVKYLDLYFKELKFSHIVYYFLNLVK